MSYPDDVPSLTDGRVTLRAHRATDRDRVYEYATDAETRRLTTIRMPYKRADAALFLAGRAALWDSGTHFLFAVEYDDDGSSGSPDRSPGGGREFAGSVGVRLLAPGIGEVGFGAHPDARGRGVMTAALGLLAEWAFETLGLTTLVWRSTAGNIGSWRVAWRSGFRFEGLTRGSHAQRGTVVDGWRATLLSTDDRAPQSRWLPCQRIADASVVLRPLESRDELRYLETVLDAETEQWLQEIPLARDPADFQSRVRDRELAPSLGRSREWAIADPHTDAYVGGLSMFGFDGLDHASAEVGYRSHPDARRRGYVVGALRLGIARAFAPVEAGGFGLARLSLGAGAGNEGSQRVARAAGFTETGRDRQCYRLADGRVVDLVRFDLLRAAPDEGRQSSYREA